MKNEAYFNDVDYEAMGEMFVNNINTLSRWDVPLLPKQLIAFQSKSQATSAALAIVLELPERMGN